MTDWLLGTLVATSGLIVLVLLVREPVRRHFGARVAYGLWLIPAARLLMPTITHTVERTAPSTSSPSYFVPQASVEPMLLATIAPPEPTLIDQLGMNLIAAADRPFVWRLVFFLVVLVITGGVTVFTIVRSKRLADLLDALSDERISARRKWHAFVRTWSR